MSKEEKTIIYYRETNWQSVVADSWIFVMLIGAMAINHFYLGGNAIWAFLLFVLVISAITSNAKAKKHRFGSKEEIIKYLQDHD